MGRVVAPDLETLDALLRLWLQTRRSGMTLVVHNAGPALVDLIELAGLSDILRVEP